MSAQYVSAGKKVARNLESQFLGGREFNTWWSTKTASITDTKETPGVVGARPSGKSIVAGSWQTHTPALSHRKCLMTCSIGSRVGRKAYVRT